MKTSIIVKKLAANKDVFQHLLSNLTKEEILWRPHPKHWCLLEILCHLNDNEHEDFKIRVKSTLENPANLWTNIEPFDWVIERAYMEKDFEKNLATFLQKRTQSIQWLNGLQNPKWENTYHHPTFGELTARNLLVNWLAHDNLHIRQITRVKYFYLKEDSGENLSYAGIWGQKN